MSQPTITDLFGTGATLASNGDVTFHSFNNATALQALATIIQHSSAWLDTNTDQTVMADVSLSSVAPVTRNSIARTRFNFSYNFYESYTAPVFDPTTLPTV